MKTTSRTASETPRHYSFHSFQAQENAPPELGSAVAVCVCVCVCGSGVGGMLERRVCGSGVGGMLERRGCGSSGVGGMLERRGCGSGVGGMLERRGCGCCCCCCCCSCFCCGNSSSLARSTLHRPGSVDMIADKLKGITGEGEYFNKCVILAEWC